MSRSPWPPLPRVVPAPGGPVKVRLIKRLHHADGDACWGTWDESTRTIRIERHAKPEHRWRVYFHELAHCWLSDAGTANLLTEPGAETLCDTIATGRMAEMRAALGL